MSGNLKTWKRVQYRKVDTALSSLLNELGPNGDAVLSLMNNNREYVKLVSAFMVLAAKTSPIPSTPT